MSGVINAELTLSAIATKAANRAEFPDQVTERCWLSSIDAIWTLSNYTPAADAGPLLVGIMHSDYTVAELEEFIENVNSWNQGDLVQTREIGRRFIRQIGIFETPADATVSVRLNDGKSIHTKCGWMLNTGETLDVWIYNLGGASIDGTTAPNLAGRGTAHLWKR